MRCKDFARARADLRPITGGFTIIAKIRPIFRIAAGTVQHADVQNLVVVVRTRADFILVRYI